MGGVLRPGDGRGDGAGLRRGDRLPHRGVADEPAAGGGGGGAGGAPAAAAGRAAPRTGRRGRPAAARAGPDGAGLHVRRSRPGARVLAARGPGRRADPGTRRPRARGVARRLDRPGERAPGRPRVRHRARVLPRQGPRPAGLAGAVRAGPGTVHRLLRGDRRAAGQARRGLPGARRQDRDDLQPDLVRGVPAASRYGAAPLAVRRHARRAQGGRPAGGGVRRVPRRGPRADADRRRCGRARRPARGAGGRARGRPRGVVPRRGRPGRGRAAHAGAQSPRPRGPVGDLRSVGHRGGGGGAAGARHPVRRPGTDTRGNRERRRGNDRGRGGSGVDRRGVPQAARPLPGRPRPREGPRGPGRALRVPHGRRGAHRHWFREAGTGDAGKGGDA